MEPTNEWLPAKDALERYEKGNGGPAPLKLNIAEYLRDDRLQARAKFIWRGKAPNISAAWEALMPQLADLDACEPVPVARAVWRSSRRWPSDQADWRWPQSRFSITRRPSPNRTLLVGVAFRVDQLEQLFGVASVMPIAKGAGGRKRDQDRWRAFWHEVVKLAANNQLNTDNYPTQADLIVHLQEQMGKRGQRALGDTMLKPEVSDLWAEFLGHSMTTGKAD